MYVPRRKIISIVVIGIFLLFSLFPIFTANEPMNQKQRFMNPFFNEHELDQYQTQTETDNLVPFGVFSVDNTIKLAQSFKPTYPILSKIEILLDKKPNANTVQVAIKENLNQSSSLRSINLRNNEIEDYPSWTIVEFDDISVIPEQTYYIECSTQASAVFIYQWYYGGEEVDNYNRGKAHVFENGAWNPTGTDEKMDFCFKTYGISSGIDPIPDFSWTPESPKINEMITFNASASYDPDGEIELYRWDWDNDGIYDEVYQSPIATHAFGRSVDHPVTLQVADNHNNSNETTKKVTIFDLIVPDDYPTIQEAIDESEEGDAIYVRSGADYEENLKIKTEKLQLKGENNSNTIIKATVNDHVIDIYEDAHNVKISGFTIINNVDGYAGINVQSNYNVIQETRIIDNGCGIKIDYSYGNDVTGNHFQNNDEAISIRNYSFASTIVDNTIRNNQDHGIYIDNLSYGHTIKDNVISYNDKCGIKIEGVSKGMIVRNNVIRNNDIGIECVSLSDGNRFYYNCFKQNRVNAFDSAVDRWDSDVIGNYWDDYSGPDADGDGIGDIPYYIPGGNNVDRYPLMSFSHPPTRPIFPDGESIVRVGVTYTYETMSIDPDGDDISYGWDWDGDDVVNTWTGFYPSGEMVSIQHQIEEGDHTIRVKAKDRNNMESEWSVPLGLNINKTKEKTHLNDELPRFFQSIISKLKHLINSIQDIFDHKIHKQTENNKILSLIGNEIYVPDDYQTIQEAIDMSDRFDKIIVRSGTYEERITINKPLTLTVEEEGLVIIDGEGSNDDIIEIISDDVELSNFIIQNGHPDHAGIKIDSDNNLIINNIIKNCGTGIDMIENENNAISGNNISETNFGIFAIDGHELLIQNNMIRMNAIGLFFERTNDERHLLTIRNNTIAENAQYGATISLSYDVEVKNNTLSKNNDFGLFLKNIMGSMIIENKILDNYHGIEMDGSYTNTFLCNLICDNSTPMEPEKGEMNSILGILIVDHCENNVFHHNDFYNWMNVFDGCKNQYYHEEQGNFWNDYNGNDWNSDGIGEIQYDIPGGENIDPYPYVEPCRNEWEEDSEDINVIKRNVH